MSTTAKAAARRLVTKVTSGIRGRLSDKMPSGEFARRQTGGDVSHIDWQFEIADRQLQVGLAQRQMSAGIGIGDVDLLASDSAITCPPRVVRYTNY